MTAEMEGFTGPRDFVERDPVKTQSSPSETKRRKTEHAPNIDDEDDQATPAGNLNTVEKEPGKDGRNESSNTNELSTPAVGDNNAEMASLRCGVLNPKGLKAIGLGVSGYVYRCEIAFKQNGTEREYSMMKQCGTCSIAPICRVMDSIGGNIVCSGFLMELATPFDFKKTAAEDRAGISKTMIELVTRLHVERGIVHGDVKPTNFLWATDGRLCLCDFDSSRRMDEDPSEWDGLYSERYLSPNRGFPGIVRAPTVEDDMYALAISIWELYTGADALLCEDMEEVLAARRTIDIGAIEDKDIRAQVGQFLAAGGALV